MSYYVTAVPISLIPYIWKDVKQFLQDAIDESNGETNIEITYADLMSGECMLLLVYKDGVAYGAINLRRRQFDTGKDALFVTLLGGINMQSWIRDAQEVGLKAAKELGCTEMYCVGRAGWEKVLKDVGYKRAYTILSYEVN